MIGDGFERILARARDGDELAWTVLYDDLAGPLLGYLRGRGAPEPEDQLGGDVPPGRTGPQAFHR